MIHRRTLLTALPLTAIASCLSLPAAQAATFTDVPTNHPQYKEISWCVTQNLVTGWSGKTFRPNNLVTRDATAAFIYRLAGSPTYTPPAISRFTDVPLNHLFTKKINWLYDMKTTHKGLTTLLAPGMICGPILTAAPAYAAGLPTVTQVKENTQTGQRTSATMLNISLGAGVNGSLDVGTGNLLSTMNLAGMSLSYNSLTPQTTGIGTRNNWRISGLGAGNLYMDNTNVILVKADGERITFVPSATNTYTDVAGKRYSLLKTATGFTLTAWDSNTVIYYSADGYPQKAVDRNGNTIQLTNAKGLPSHLAGWQGPDASKNTWMIPGTTTDTFGASLGVGYSGGFSIDPMAQSADGQSNFILERALVAQAC